MTSAFSLSFAMVVALFSSAQAQGGADFIMVRSSTKTPDAVVADIKAYADHKKWQYLGENKVKNGEVRLVKICIPAVGQLLWSAGLHLSAMLPCGNIGVYRNGEATEISILHSRYMHVLFPHPATERASALAQPLLDEMLETVTRAPQMNKF